MAQPYIGEIRIFAGNFEPAGWAFCAGQLLQISENDTLFNLIGTTYGGDGESTFALPDLRGRIPLHQGQGPGLQNYALAEAAGAEEVTLTTQQMPTHNHPLLASGNTATATTASGSVTASTNQLKIYFEGSPSKTFAPNTIAQVGGSQPHTNFAPYLCLNFIISLFGIYPSPT
jgi:microcystin-dependent protein